MNLLTPSFWVVCRDYAHDCRTAEQAQRMIDRLAAAAQGDPRLCSNPHAIVQSVRDPRRSHG